MDNSRREGDTREDSDGEQIISRTSSRRRSAYDDQRSSKRPISGESSGTSRSRSKRSSYKQPGEYDYTGDEAVPPPVNPDDWKQQHPPTPLEDNVREQAQQRSNIRRRHSGDRVSEELTEAAIPQPVSRNRNERNAAERETEQRSPAPFQSRHPNEFARKEEQAPKYLTELYTISYLIFFAIWGTLARLGVQWLTFYPGTPVVTPVIWANFGGSLIFGFLAEDQALFRDPSSAWDNGVDLDENDAKGYEARQKEAKEAATKRKKAVPLFIGLSTGFCGSFTSFSSFARDIFLALSDDLPTPINHPNLPDPTTTSTVSRNGGYSLEAILHIIIATLALSLGGLIVGGQLAAFLDPLTPRIHGRFVRTILNNFMIFLAFGCWLGAILLAIFPPSNSWRGEVLFALIFAPLGCLLRFYASKKLNSLAPAFPLGTFAVNMFGTAIEGMCFDIQHVRVGVLGQLGGGMVGCQVLQGVMDGFCGCLTTVSTWVGEINGLKRKHGWGYAFGSVVGGLGLMVVIMGSVRWTVGFSDPVCNTGYTSKIHG